MKTGRNNPCPCGSGKKYKRCCLEKEGAEQQEESTRNPFQLKGEKAEKWIYELSTKSFLTDWCYPTPKLSDGKELCDLLIIFDEIAIIWQIKDLKVKDGKYNEREVKKNLSQLSGASRSLFDLKREITLENPRRDKDKFDPSKIKEVYLISALTGEEENFFSFFEKFKDKRIHVFNKEAVEIILKELDTIKDFIGYLKEKEKLFSLDTRVFWGSGEKDLLAYYLLNGRSFNELIEADAIFLDEGFWDNLQKRPEYLSKKKEDEISYLWDDIINRIHTCGGRYEIIAKELARTNRFDRRYLSKAFFDAHMFAHNEIKNNSFKRVLDSNSVTYCFLFLDNLLEREKRKSLLQSTCFVARGLNKQNKKVIGIATEMKISKECSYDFCLLDFPDWTDDNQKEMERIQKETGILTNLKYKSIHEDEYPKIE